MSGAKFRWPSATLLVLFMTVATGCGAAPRSGATTAGQTEVGQPAAVAATTTSPSPTDEEQLVAGQEGGLPARTAGPRSVVRERRTGMGGMMEILVATDQQDAAKQAITEAFAEISRIDQLTTDNVESSEVSKINQNSGSKEPIPISAELLKILEAAREVSDLSAGTFDVTWAALRGLWRFDQAAPVIPSEEEIRSRLQLIGYQQLELSRTPPSARLAKAGAAIGLGGLAKGYAVDQAAKILRAKGFTDFIVYTGGDLYTSGQKEPGKPWTVGIQHPRVPGALISVFPAPGGAIVTSGDYEQFFEKDGVRYHHIIDLKTGSPARQAIAATIISPDAMLADALCTAVFILGPEKGLELAHKIPGIEAVVIDLEGRAHLTEGLKQKIRVNEVKLH